MSELREQGLMQLWECPCGATFEKESDAQAHLNPPEHPWLSRMTDDTAGLMFIHPDKDEWWAEPE